MQEEWIETNNKSDRGDKIIAVSNKGRIKRANGNPPEESFLRQQITVNGKRMRIHRFIADNFIPKTKEDEELKRDCIDHCTHNPIGMNVNDIRNLRWCSRKENNNFQEARNNKIMSDFGRKYKEHYGYGRSENKKQYDKECTYYNRKGKCRWE